MISRNFPWGTLNNNHGNNFSKYIYSEQEVKTDLWKTTLYTLPYPPFPKTASSSNSFRYREVCASKATSLDLNVKYKQPINIKTPENQVPGIFYIHCITNLPNFTDH